MPLTSRSSGGSRLAAVSLSPAAWYHSSYRSNQELRLPEPRYGSVWIRMRGERGKLARSALRSGVEKPDTEKRKPGRCQAFLTRTLPPIGFARFVCKIIIHKHGKSQAAPQAAEKRFISPLSVNSSANSSRPADETGTAKDRAISLVSFRSPYEAHPCRA